MFAEAGYRQPTFYFPWKTFHLRQPERIAHALTLCRFPDVFYGSYTVAAEPATGPRPSREEG
jgi:hypothetical protein